MTPGVETKEGAAPKRSAAPARQKPGPNWLLRGLILFSAAVHVFVFLHIAGIYRSETLTAIELTLQERKRPDVRDIPLPRPRPKHPPKPQEVEPLKAQRRLPPDIKPMKMAPVDPRAPDSLVETLSVPETPAVSAPPVAAWTGGPPVVAGGFGSARDYFDMVRLLIERNKVYPSAARARQVEGRVTVRFTIAPDGSVRSAEVVKSSKKGILDEAALDAVRKSSPFPRPPRHLFSGDLPLEITIQFELM
ncbi:MAG: TonB family protein [Desulfobacterales bacterium]|nr:TonB family protein [Desulfobacterales bacterium]